MFFTSIHVKAEDLVNSMYPSGISEMEKENILYYLREEPYVRGDSAYAIKFWADKNGVVFDADDNSYTAKVGRWIDTNVPNNVDYIYVDFED